MISHSLFLIFYTGFWFILTIIIYSVLCRFLEIPGYRPFTELSKTVLPFRSIILVLRLQKIIMMKKIIVFVLATCFSVMAISQVKKKPAPAVAQPVLKTTTDSISYALGLNFANFCKQQGIEALNAPLVSKAINDALKNNKLQLNEQQANNTIIGYIQKIKTEKSAEGRKAGDAFLEANKTKPGVTVLPSGLQYSVIKEGTGPKPAATDKVKCNYEGRLIDGTVFDSSEKQGQPIEFAVNGVIAGWTEALQLMPTGSKWRLYIPANLAYGDQQPSSVIKPGSTLVFDVELLDIVK
jgi:FKBP-type peptidyl-prolyl cis-trans isomerase FklB